MKTYMLPQSTRASLGQYPALSSTDHRFLLLYLFFGSILVRSSSKPSWMKPWPHLEQMENLPSAATRYKSCIIFALPCKLLRLPKVYRV